MSPTINGIAESIVPARYSVDVQIFNMPEPMRKALYAKIAELKKTPIEDWDAHQADELESPFEGTYRVAFTDELRAYVTPLPDGKFRIESISSQSTIDSFQSHAEANGTP